MRLKRLRIGESKSSAGQQGIARTDIEGWQFLTRPDTFRSTVNVPGCNGCASNVEI